MIKYICDKCKGRIHGYSYDYNNIANGENFSADLCANCRTEVHDFIFSQKANPDVDPSWYSDEE